MKPKAIIRMIVNISMTVVMLFLMSYMMIGETSHEVLGVSITVLVTVHHILNNKWWKNIFKGKYSPFRKVQTAVILLIFCTTAGSAVSGIILSKHLFLFLNISAGVSAARIVHMICAYWGFLLMSVHLGFHWNMMISMAGKSFKGASPIIRKIVVYLGYAAAVYGLIAAVKRRFFSYLFLLNQFVYFDMNENVAFFIIDYVFIMCTFVLAGHYVRKYFSESVVSGSKQ